MNDDPPQSPATLSLMARVRDIFTDNIADTEELIRVLRKAQRKKVLDNDALSIIEGALQVSDMQVRDIMVPRSQVVTVRASDPPQDILPVVIEA